MNPNWSTVDWSKSDEEIAREYNVDIDEVRKARRIYGPEPIKPAPNQPPAPKKTPNPEMLP